MSGLNQSSIKILIFLSSYCIGVSSIAPEFIWNVINATISSYQSHCPKVVLYSRENENLVPRNSTGEETVLININEQAPEDIIENVRKVKGVMDKINLNTERPCIIMISIVNSSADSNSTISSDATEEEIQYYKLTYSQQLVEYLQFKTPMKCRKLVLVRLADKGNELYSCTKAAKYPRRLVPIWEQVLFDFFYTVKVIQGRVTDDEKELTVAQEYGQWTWLCEDVIKRLEAEEQCQRNNTDQCRQDQADGKFSNLKNNSVCSSDRNFKARQ